MLTADYDIFVAKLVVILHNLLTHDMVSSRKQTEKEQF